MDRIQISYASSLVPMIWLTFGKNSLETRCPTEDILKKIANRKACGRDILWAIA